MNPASEARSYPLTPLQQGMLFHLLSSRPSGVDIEQIVATLEEAVDAALLRRAWEEILARQPALRVAFRWEGLAEPEQAPQSACGLPFAEEDLRADTTRGRDAVLSEWLSRDRGRPFDPGRAPLLRLALLRLGERSFALVWTFHHLVLDGRSFAHVLQEVFATYDAQRGGSPAVLAAPRGFEEHVEHLRRRDRAGDEPFWRQYLAGFAGPLALPLSRPVRDRQDGGPARGETRLRVAADATARLRAVAVERGISLNTLVQGAWALVLSRYTGESDVVFGCVRACRRSSVPGADSIVGTFINTLPFRAVVDESLAVGDWLGSLRASQRAIAPHEHAALADIQRWMRLPAGARLFESILVYDESTLDTQVRALPGAWATRSFRLHEQTVYPLTLYAYGEPELDLTLAYDRTQFEDGAMARMLGHCAAVLRAFAAHPTRALREVALMPEEESQELLQAWRSTQRTYDRTATLDALFAAQAARTPDALALRCAGREVRYAELDRLSNRVAHRLRALGVAQGVIVGVHMRRSIEMVVAVLGIAKAGGAWLPLDPAYPAERTAFQVEDSRAGVIVTQPDLAGTLPAGRAQVVALDEGPSLLAGHPETPVERCHAAGDLAYVIYTSGSTGRPKGVMVEHRNAVNFFVGMDERLGDERGVWLAVTSLSFDISILELVWTLTRGFEVVVQPAARAQAGAGAPDAPRPSSPMRFSLFYFSSDEGESSASKYRLLLEGARFADQNGFEAVWTPERHFHAFGGLFPNPSVTSAALATITQRVALRAGSVVLPLHDPIRIAEEWALVDNLSQGRVGIAFASGWQANDFVLAPGNYAQRKDVMVRGIDTVRRLWRGETIQVPGPDGALLDVRTLPRPVQPELPVWITTAGNVETYRAAGELGANVLTHLLGQSLSELAGKIAAYREARHAAGHAGHGQVTLMLHTFVGRSEHEVHATVRAPMIQYLKSSVGLARNFIGSFPTFKTQSAGEAERMSSDFQALDGAELEALLGHAFERYFDQSGLFGTPESCERMVDRVRAIGVDEIACLIDFGVPSATVLEHLADLGELRRRVAERELADQAARVPLAIERHQVTHLQCTPSMASMLLAEEDGPQALGRLKLFCVGGEAFPPALAREIGRHLGGRLVNMYGPTETTIWSSTHAVAGVEDSIPIGRPIANTELLVLDAQRRLQPRGVPGELYIGGDGVARGYLERPELTAERFVPHPFRAEGGRLYRTGDLARLREDGEFEFLGRNDTQVKLRGYRIELGEIEARLSEHPAIRECAVVVRAVGTDDPRLVAYFATRDGDALERESLRAWLLERLPEFMLPSAWVQLPALPQTPNAKIDRKALPAPEDVVSEPRRSFQAPENELERQIAAIWREVLAGSEVGRDENFFDLGGHSLLTVQVQGRLKRTLGRSVALTDLFRFPTVRSLAQFLSGPADDRELDKTAEDRARARLDGADRRRRMLEGRTGRKQPGA
ncbi:MAG: LLM class flavin-dependent oxidoreductase [Planctomycetes bacterium]|nr:LLM class flavin-dependent oxidoreductase [Planctomycetota bacterium]